VDPAHLDELARRENNYWWHVNRHRLVMKHLRDGAALPGRVLDLGCGAGHFSAQLQAHGIGVVAADIAPQAARYVRAKGVREAVVFDANKTWPFTDDTFDAIVMLDALEHIAEDINSLTEAHRVLTPGGRVFITVPAHQFLYSQWDRVLQHHRRYSRRKLGTVLSEAGLRVDLLRYHNLIAFIPAVLRLGRHASRAEFPNLPRAVNSLLKAAGTAERCVPSAAVPVGLSLFAVARQV
jgi:SAM-dependent methyltransferase